MQKQEAIQIKVLKCLHDTDVNYDAIKKEALKNSPLVATYPLSVFELGRSKTIKMNGKLVPVNTKAYFSFLKKVLRVDPQFVSRFKNVTDEKTELSMLGALKSGMSKNKDLQVHVLANPKELSITNFASGRHQFRTNEQLLAIFENVMNRYPSLHLRDFHMSEDGTMNLAARSEDEVFGELKNEVFRGGLTFRNSYDNGSFIGHNAFRMICTNGMFGFGDLPLFVGPDDKGPGKRGTGGGLIDFFEKLDVLDRSNWMADDFWDRMQDAMDTDASVAELFQAKNALLMNSSLEEADIKYYLPELHDARKWLAKRGVIMDTLEGKKLNNCPTNIKLWQLINQVTDFGSHDYGFEQNFDKIQRSGGSLFAKNYDTKNLVVFN